MTNDVEKRWRDPPALRAAIGYVAVVVILAAGALTAFVITDPVAAIWSFGPSAVLFAGALGAFVKTYADWRAFRTWPIWHGAGWFLLTLALAGFALPTMGATA
jgi:protein-S-isoprenylcysteine O-methyltransferase Ste14